MTEKKPNISLNDLGKELQLTKLHLENIRLKQWLRGIQELNNKPTCNSYRIALWCEAALQGKEFKGV